LKLVSIVGARPQFIKAATLSRAMAAAPGLDEVMVHTGQHFDAEMSAVFFDELGIPAPAHQLGIHGGSHGEMTGRMLVALEAVLAQERPDRVIVYGDTNSTLAGALAAAKLNLPVAHIEAGLRSFNRAMPEEINRVVADRVSDLLFCPTRAALDNLRREGATRGVHHVGDVMYDATLHAAALAHSRSTVLARFKLQPGAYALATLHRAETVDDPARLIAALDWLKARAAEHVVVFPIHPRTAARVAAAGFDLAALVVAPPLGYLDIARLLQDAAAVYTDSGGLQKEAYFHRKPCVTLRDETEWVETVACGWNRLWRGPDYAPCREIDDYGSGRAAERIVEILRAAA
jgi:UDP-GlcNAc3NAcA epimerase